MFEKLLATLPYNPGLAHQLAFYGRRMREESTIRRTGLIFIILAFMIQFFAVLNPPQPAAAASTNDLIYGGINTPPAGVSPAQEAANKCNANIRGYGAIMAYYGIDCSVIAGAQTDTIYAHGSNGQLFSMGNNAYGKPSETAVAINGGNTVFWRHLYDWDFGGQPIKVLTFGAHGQHFYIIYDCGNLVSIGLPQKYTPPAPPPPTQQVGLGNQQVVAKPPAAKPAPAVTPAPVPPVTPNTPIKPCQYDSSITADNTSCKPCRESASQTDTTACVVIHKTAANVTAGIVDANNTTANAGDVITYTLYAKNNGKATVKDYIFVEPLSDVLDYAGVTDLHGGIIDNSSVVSWSGVSIKAGETVTKQITVTVKNPIPQTAAGQSDPARFDLNMNNVYGNAINIRLPGSPQKTVETTAASLPNTGPGTNIFVGSMIVVIAGYFFGRARLLAKESALALKESTI